MFTPFRLDPINEHGLCWLTFERNGDRRGWLSEIFNQSAATSLGLPHFGQDNVSRTGELGQIRGLHFQSPPASQAKLFRVVSGRVFNVVVDLRPAQFGVPHVCEISSDMSAWLCIPEGYAHGFQTLESDVEVHYKVSHPYDATALAAVKFDDPPLGVHWPLPCPTERLSERDRTAPSLERSKFHFQSLS